MSELEPPQFESTAGEKGRCLWCERRLRWWQIAYCRRCNRAMSRDAGIYLQGPGPPFRRGSQRDAPPDGLWGSR